MAETTFGRYRLSRLLARGGMAEVYLAILTGAAGFEKRIALKKILPIYTDLDEFTKLFQDEARISVTLNHSNIVQVFDFGVHHGEHYLAMEYIDGPDLEKVLMGARKLGRQLAIDAVLYVAVRLAAALEYAHSRVDEHGRSLDLVHRDVSPPNVLLSVQGEVKLTDFGVARYQQRLSRSRPGVVRGKYAYMSPEQLTGEVIDGRSDLFSFGVLLYELLTNVNPFLGDTDYQTMERVVNARPAPVTDLRADVPRDLVRIVERCLRPNPATRYQLAVQIRRDLAELMFNRGVIDDAQLLTDELWSLFPRQLGRRGVSVPAPRDDDAAVSFGVPRMRAGGGVTTGEDWGKGESRGPARIGPPVHEDEDDDDLTIPHMVANPDAIPTLPLDGRSHTMDAPPLAPASQATLQAEAEEDPFAVRRPSRGSVAPRASVQVDPPSEVTAGERLQAALAAAITDDSLSMDLDDDGDERADRLEFDGGSMDPASGAIAADVHALLRVGAVGAESLVEPAGGVVDAAPVAEPEALAVPVTLGPAAGDAEPPPLPQDAPVVAAVSAPASPGEAVASGEAVIRSTDRPPALPPRPRAAPREEEELPLWGYVAAGVLVVVVLWVLLLPLLTPTPSADLGAAPRHEPAPQGDTATLVVAPRDAVPPAQPSDGGPQTLDGSEQITPVEEEPPLSPAAALDESVDGPERSTPTPAPPTATPTPAPPKATPTPAPPKATPTPTPAPPKATATPTPAPPKATPTPTPAPATATPTPGPPPSAPSVAVTLTTTPAGAALRVDGRSVGKAPYSMVSTPGTALEVAASLPGHLNTTRVVKVTDASDQLIEVRLAADESVVLPPATVSLTITSEPWGYVTIDGRNLGKSTPITLELPPGEHSIKVENPIEAWSETRVITLEAGSGQTVALRRP